MNKNEEKRVKGLLKRWYMLRDLLGFKSDKCNYKNGYTIKERPKNIAFKNRDDDERIKKLFKILKTEKQNINGVEREFLEESHAMKGTTEMTLTQLMNLKNELQLGNKVLCIGCGILSQQFKATQACGFDTYGLDIEVEKDTDNLKFHDLNSNNEIPYENKFDFVVCQEVIEHLENPWLLFRKVKKVLKENGVLIVTTPNITSDRSKEIFMASDFGNFNHFEDIHINVGSHINPIPFWEMMKIAKYNNFELKTLTGNLEHFLVINEGGGSNYEIKNSLRYNDISIYVFINKDNIVKDYIPRSEAKAVTEWLKNKK